MNLIKIIRRREESSYNLVLLSFKGHEFLSYQIVLNAIFFPIFCLQEAADISSVHNRISMLIAGVILGVNY